MHRSDGNLIGTALAHSPRQNVPAQSYRRHVEEVVRHAVAHARAATAFYTGDRNRIIEDVRAAALYHDLGKLDEQNQAVLRRVSREPLPVAHEDAGVATLLGLQRQEAMVLAAGHHAGLFSQEAERKKQRRCFRCLRPLDGSSVADHVDVHLEQYLDQHVDQGCEVVVAGENAPLSGCGFTRRVSLSCLVDADHGDTARNYRNEVPLPESQPRWADRLAALEDYVASLSQDGPRNALRRDVFSACRNASVTPVLRSCDAPVGAGKTTAVMAHLLNVARQRRLRHIIVVLPYINIIHQSVDVYRKALTLPGENAADIIAEHHHEADFSNLETRQWATLWRSPIIVTTAVQFFESLASHHPARLRKLHELPGSAVFIDETHAAIPSHLWPQMWRWLETWTRDWGGHVVFASGSLPRFWQRPEFADPPKAEQEVPDLIPDGLRQRLEEHERLRIAAERIPLALTVDDILQRVRNADGPRLLIVNTVQSAAVLADRMRRQGSDVLHLSTALAPIHRKIVVERVKERLSSGNKDWALVATSCVEAGVDFSFRTGFRESASTASLIQVGGRVNRGAEHGTASVFDFRLLHGEGLTDNPALAVPQRVLGYLFGEERFRGDAASDLALEAMCRELTEAGRGAAEDIGKKERGFEYPDVAHMCRVIQDDTRLVIIDPDVSARLKAREKVDRLEVLRYSVRIWASKVNRRDLPLELLVGEEGDIQAVYGWTADYDPDFLGYMAGVLPLLESLRTGMFIA